MTEKEFLIKFSNWLLTTRLEKKGREEHYYIDEFLETFHKEYYEVEFIKKDIGGELYGIPWIFDPILTKDDIYFVKGDRVLGKLIIGVDLAKEGEDTTEIFVKKVSPIELTAEQAENMREMYNKAMKDERTIELED